MNVMNPEPETPLESEAALTQHLAGRFLANASHELRTPLTAILGFSELLLEDTYGPLNDAQRTALGHVEESAAEPASPDTETLAAGAPPETEAYRTETFRARC